MNVLLIGSKIGQSQIVQLFLAQVSLTLSQLGMMNRPQVIVCFYPLSCHHVLLLVD